MTAVNIAQERRTKRSDHAHRAITFQLEHVLRAFGLRNFTLSDTNGLRIAHAGCEHEAEAFAAYAPSLSQCPDREHREVITGHILDYFSGHLSTKTTLHARRFIVDGEPLYLCVAGEGCAKMESCMWRAISGIRRIYG